MGFYFQEPELLQYLMRNFHIQPWSLALISFLMTGSKTTLLKTELSYPIIKTCFMTQMLRICLRRKCWPPLQRNSCFTIPSQERHFCLLHQSQRLPQLLRNKQFITEPSHLGKIFLLSHVKEQSSGCRKQVFVNCCAAVGYI